MVAEILDGPFICEHIVGYLQQLENDVFQVNEVLRQFPRNTFIGPSKGLFWYRTEALGEMLFIARRFYKDVAAEDSGIDGSPPQPAT